MNIIGVLVLFKFGFPQPTFEEGISLGLEDNNILEDGKSVKDTNIKIKKRKFFYKKMSYGGLVFILVGFFFQLIAVVWCYN